MKICTKCILPETFSDIHFDENGVCNFCHEHEKRKGMDIKNEICDFTSEDELATYLEKFKNPENNYDVLVSLSGGVDSSYALIKIVEKFKLRPLCFHNDYALYDDTSSDNVKKICKALGVDYILWRNEYDFMKKVWKYANEANLLGMSGCYFCGNMVHLNALELADRFNISLVINGLSKGQAWTMNNVDKARTLMGEMVKLISRDEEFFLKYMQKNELLAKQKVYQKREDITIGHVDGKILIVPFYVFKFYKTDKNALRKECMQVFDWKEPKSTYPARTTNCEMSWINSYCDLKKMGYSTYHEEYAQLIREGEMSREQALKDLELNPPQGLLERLAKEININL